MNAHSTIAEKGQYLTFMINAQGYGVPVLSVREINQMCQITPIPKTPDFIRGVINLRGRMIPIVDLKQKFGLCKTDFTKETCIVVIESNIGQIGVLVDQVNDVVDLQNDQIEPSPNLGETSNHLILGMGKLPDRVVILIDIVRALSKDEFLKELGVAAASVQPERNLA